MAKVQKHHVINGSIAAVVAVAVSLAAWLVVHSGIASSSAASAGTYACFKNASGQVYLREKCKSGEKRVLINGTGLQGARGYSNFELAQQNGFTGTVAEWLKTLVGPAGSSGSGSSGATGATGSTGPAGPTGPKGDPGADGLIPDYGYFIDTTTQNMLAINTPTAMKFGTNLIANKGVTITGADKTRITFAEPGVYNIQFSAQIFKNTSTNTADIDIWLSQGGQTVADSNTQLTITNDIGKTGKAVAAWNFFVTITASGQYCELMWSSASSVISLPYVAPQTTPDRPGIPSVILSVNQVG
ncbi:MAG: hypothetical protein RL100_316 [Actinomycetota bacterium]|jgi:hypothetical protein